MNLLKKLIEKYGYNEPIFISEVTLQGYSAQTLRQLFKRLTDAGKIARFDSGIYYIPTNTAMGKSVLNPRQVIEKKYITDNNKVFGFYSGISLKNSVGLTKQMPNIIEIVTNNESSRVRNVSIGKQMVRLRKSRTSITNMNVGALQVLDLFNGIEYNQLDSNERKAVFDYIRSKNLTQRQVFENAKNFPMKALKKMIESGVVYEFTKKPEILNI